MKITQRNFLRIASVSTLLVISTMSGAQATQHSEQPMTNARSIALHTMARDEPDGLHRAALANGGTFETGGRSAPLERVGSLSNLVTSPIIVSVKVIESHSILEDQGHSISTLYTLEVDHIFKGSNIPHILKLVEAGGVYKFSDGSKVIQTEELHRPLVPNVEYIIFPQAIDDRPGFYYLPFLGQCVFEMARDGHHVYSHTYVHEDHLQDEAKVGKDKFIQRLESLIAAEKK